MFQSLVLSMVQPTASLESSSGSIAIFFKLGIEPGYKLGTG